MNEENIRLPLKNGPSLSFRFFLIEYIVKCANPSSLSLSRVINTPYSLAHVQKETMQRQEKESQGKIPTLALSLSSLSLSLSPSLTVEQRREREKEKEEGEKCNMEFRVQKLSPPHPALIGPEFLPILYRMKDQ